MSTSPALKQTPGAEDSVTPENQEETRQATVLPYKATEEPKSTPYLNDYRYPPTPDNHVAHFPGAMYSLNSGMFPTQERLWDANDTGLHNMTELAAKVVLNDVRESLRNSLKKNPEFKYQRVREIEQFVREAARRVFKANNFPLPSNVETNLEDKTWETVKEEFSFKDPTHQEPPSSGGLFNPVFSFDLNQ